MFPDNPVKPFAGCSLLGFLPTGRELVDLPDQRRSSIWEGDELIVDTVGFSPGTLGRNFRTGPFHGDELHVTEHFVIDTEQGALRRSWSAEDPAYFEGEYSGQDVVFVADIAYEPYNCEDLTSEYIE